MARTTPAFSSQEGLARGLHSRRDARWSCSIESDRVAISKSEEEGEKLTMGEAS
jgi:hypothetical protein